VREQRGLGSIGFRLKLRISLWKGSDQPLHLNHELLCVIVSFNIVMLVRSARFYYEFFLHRVNYTRIVGGKFGDKGL